MIRRRTDIPSIGSTASVHHPRYSQEDSMVMFSPSPTGGREKWKVLFEAVYERV
jgi:hypothetical protein